MFIIELFSDRNTGKRSSLVMIKIDFVRSTKIIKIVQEFHPLGPRGHDQGFVK